MGRKKVKLQYIQNDTARKVTYNKRSKSLLKKTQEISVLCGIDTCTIIYSKYDQTPRMWPENRADVVRIVRKYKDKIDIDSTKRKFNQEEFLKESKNKMLEKINRVEKKNTEMAMENTIVDLLTGKPVKQGRYTDIPVLKWVIEDKLRTIARQLMLVEEINNNAKNATPSNLIPNSDINLNSPLGNEMIVGSTSLPFEGHAGPSNLSHYYYQP
ncbi:hypothetical protein vseg_012098 [Gypsophila vaccaria]